MKDSFIVMLIVIVGLFVGAVGFFWGTTQYRTNSVVQDINRTAKTTAVVSGDHSVRATPGTFTVPRSAFEKAFAARFPNQTDAKLKNIQYQFDYRFAFPGPTSHGTVPKSYQTGFIKASDLTGGTYQATKIFPDRSPLKAIRIRVKATMNGQEQVYQGTVVMDTQKGLNEK